MLAFSLALKKENLCGSIPALVDYEDDLLMPALLLLPECAVLPFFALLELVFAGLKLFFVPSVLVVVKLKVDSAVQLLLVAAPPKA